MESRGLDNFREQLAGFAHERFALRVFIGARSLSNEHQLRIDAANPEDHVVARGGEMGAFDARQDALA